MSGLIIFVIVRTFNSRTVSKESRPTSSSAMRFTRGLQYNSTEVQKEARSVRQCKSHRM